MTDIQSTLDELTKHADKRTSVFEIEIQELKNHRLTLSGRLLDQAQLDELHRLLPGLTLDTDLVRILSRGSGERVHVTTNLTGLYERPSFGMPLSSELCYGTELEVLDQEKRWVLTRQRDGYLGWAYRPYLGEGLAPAPSHLVLVPAVEVRAEPDATSEVVTRVVGGTGVVVETTQDGWSRIAANKAGWIQSKDLRGIADFPQAVEEKHKTMFEDSKRMTGVPYLWGGTSGNGVDCSGLARLLHRWIGVEIPRDADMQYRAAKRVEAPFEVGDLFFFAEDDSKRDITHVGICLGGWRMVHSSRGNNGVYTDDLQQRKSLMDIYVGTGSFLR